MKDADLNRLTMQAAANLYALGEMTPRQWRLYNLNWTWCAPRFSGWHAQRQDRAHARLGADLYARRMARARRRCGFAALPPALAH